MEREGTELIPEIFAKHKRVINIILNNLKRQANAALCEVITWATKVLKEYMTKGFVLDNDRLK